MGTHCSVDEWWKFLSEVVREDENSEDICNKLSNERWSGKNPLVTSHKTSLMIRGFTFCQTIRSLERQTIGQVPQSGITYVTIDFQTIKQCLKPSIVLPWFTLLYSTEHRTRVRTAHRPTVITSCANCIATGGRNNRNGRMISIHHYLRHPCSECFDKKSRTKRYSWCEWKTSNKRGQTAPQTNTE